MTADYLRRNKRATKPKPQADRAESSMDRLANAVIGKIAARDADRARAYLDGLAVEVLSSEAAP